MTYDLEVHRSHLWSLLLEFGEEILIPSRKKLRLTQRDISVRLGLNQSEVSRIERGVAKPRDFITTKAICDIYHLSYEQSRRYTEITSGIDSKATSQTTVEVLNNLLNNQISFIARLNRTGFPHAAIKHSENLREWLLNYSYSSEIYTDQIKEKTLHLLLEESAAWWDITLPHEVAEKTDSLMSCMRNIISSIQKPSSFKIYFEINKGFHSYINGDYQSSYTSFARINKDEIKDKLWQTEVFRASCINAGKLKQYNLLKRYEHLVEGYIRGYSASNLNKGYVLEGLARGFSNINTEKSLRIFKKASKYIELARKEPDFLKIRYIQFVRSYLPVIRQTKEPTSYIQNLAELAIKEADEGGFIRHKGQIIELLRSTKT